MKKIHKSTFVHGFFMLVAIGLANVVCWLISHYTGTMRAWLNLDYFIPLLLLVWRKKTAAIVALIFFILITLIDLLGIFKQLFPFMRLNDVFYLLKFTWLSSHTYQLYGVTLVILLVIQLFFLLKIAGKLYFGAWLVGLNTVLAFMLIQIYCLPKKGPVDFWLPDKQNWVASTVLDLMQYYNSGFISTYQVNGEVFQPVSLTGHSASDVLFKPGTIAQQHKVLLIVNESWGVPIQPDIQNDVIAAIRQHPQVTALQQGSLPFVGYTINGEIRELCQKAIWHFNLRHQTTGFEQCLPNQFARQGFHTVAVHGALSLMYDRRYWYPRAGFQTLLFRDTGLNLPQSVCYSFPGNCDHDIAARITEQFRQHDQLFLYWMTLNTHAVYDKRDLIDHRFQCQQHHIDPQSDACRNLQLQAQFFDTLAAMIKDPAFKGTRVIVVGDHEPPIIHQQKAAVFMQDTVATLQFEVQ